MKITDWIMGKDMDFEDTVKKEEPQHVDPVIEQRRKEKFSEPMIYNEEKKVEEQKVEVRVPVVKKKEEPKKPKKQEYVMSQIISPMNGVQESNNPVPQKKPAVKKKIKRREDDVVPVLSPFYGAQGIEEEKPVVKKAKKVEKVVKKESSEVIDSVENRLKNLSTLTLESQEDLKIVEERTGKFKHDMENEDPLIEEINDDMSYDELMNLYEKKFED